MLAYMDEILEPEDAEDIGKKIEESELARSVMQRTRDALRRMRLGAPAVEGRGLAQDANTVAEYLDNTLAAEQVPDFERICLESEVHLAEVGASHQILTLVLGEPAEVDPISRDRMYGLIATAGTAPRGPVQIASPPIEAPPVEKTTDGAGHDHAGRRHKPEVPDYLREASGAGRSRLRLALAAVFLLAAGGATAFMLLPDLREQVAALIGGNDDAAPPVSHAPIVPPRSNSIDDGPPADLGPVPPSDDGPPLPDDLNAIPPDGPPDMQDESRVSSLDQPPPNVRRQPNLTRPAVPIDNGPPAPDPDMTVDAGVPPSPDDDLPVPPGPPAPPSDGGSGIPAPPGAQASDEPSGEALGRYIYKQDVLLRLRSAERPLAAAAADGVPGRRRQTDGPADLPSGHLAQLGRDHSTGRCFRVRNLGHG